MGSKPETQQVANAISDKIVGLTLKQAVDLAAYLKEEYNIEPAAGGAVVLQTPNAKVALEAGHARREQVIAQIIRGVLEHRALLDIGEMATQLFDGDVQSAIEWLREPNGRLDGKTPLQMSEQPDGRDRVRQLITRLEHGVLL